MIDRVSVWPAVLGLALAMIVVTLIEPVPSSLAYASGFVVIMGLLGWIVEAREVAGPPPEVEPEHEEEEEAPGPSYWPVILSLGIVGIAAGLIYNDGHGSLVVAVPLAIGSAAAWATHLKKQAQAARPVEREVYAGPPISGPGGRMLLPVPGPVLAAQAAGGAAIAIEHVDRKEVSRRGLLRVTFWTSLGVGLAAMAGSIVDMLYPRGITGFGGVVSAGAIEEFPPGTKTEVVAGQFFIVNLTAEQGGPGFLALWRKCPHLGCTVPWRSDFTFTDPASGTDRVGWFRCPCHGSTYNDAGVRVYGPAPRSMDRFELTIANGRISVNTGAVTKGTTDNADFAVQA